jgi:spore coat protein H
MNLTMKFVCELLFILTVTGFNSNCQILLSNDDKLDLMDSGEKIENIINLYTSKSSYQTIKTTIGEKISIKTTKLVINGDTLIPEEISTRGQTTLYLRRKSYSIKLESAASFQHGKRKKSLKKFLVLSLSMDRNYCNNRLAFEMMESLKIFKLFYSFCELRINDQSEGICMIVERPEDWAIKKKNSPLVIRRGYDHKIDKEKTGKKTEIADAKKCKDYYRQIYRSLNKYEGEELYLKLSTWLDMDVYMKWLAFNFFVRNGDYTDEIFFYIDPEINKFCIIPWDYDDLFFPNPHEGTVKSRNIIGDKLIFSAEDLLDKKIATDPYMYNNYLIQLGNMLNQLSPAVLRKVFENTYAELYPYYSNDEIINMSEYDPYKKVNLVRLKTDMLSLFETLRISRNQYLNFLQSKIH